MYRETEKVGCKDENGEEESYPEDGVGGEEDRECVGWVDGHHEARDPCAVPADSISTLDMAGSGTRRGAHVATVTGGTMGKSQAAVSFSSFWACKVNMAQGTPKAVRQDMTRASHQSTTERMMKP